MKRTAGLPIDFVAPVLSAIDDQPDNVRQRIWAAVDRGDVTFQVTDGAIEVAAGGETFCRLVCAGVIPCAPNNGIPQ